MYYDYGIFYTARNHLKTFSIMKKNTRLCIYPKDVQQITGKSYRQSVRILKNLRKRFNKPADSYVSVTEFCIYSGLDQEEVERWMG